MSRAKAKAAAVAEPDPAQDIETFDCEQGSDEWLRLRIGLCTASNFAVMMRSGKDGGASETRAKLLNQMAGEVLTGEPAETYTNAYMQRGKDMEAEAREHYAFTMAVEPVRVGFVRRIIRDKLYGDRFVGCSPDSLLGDDGVLEIKTMAPGLLIALSESGRFPTEHRAQCHGTLWVTGRKWCDLKLFYRKMPISPIFRVWRDEAYIAEIAAAVETFQYDLTTLVKRVRSKAGK